MKRYIALLRGINVSGKNKISITELKKGFAEIGFAEITTYLNSGNVIFSSMTDDKNVLSNQIKQKTLPSLNPSKRFFLSTFISCITLSGGTEAGNA